MVKTTQIVEIEQEEMAEMTRWVQARGGQVREWDLVLGNHGHLYLNGENPSMHKFLRMQVAADRPDMVFPPMKSIPIAIRRDLLQTGADCYDYMNEGTFDEFDLPELMELAGPALQPRGEMVVKNMTAKLNYLRSQKGNNDLPGWDEMSQAQRALVHEAFSGGTEWENLGMLDPNLLNRLNKLLRAEVRRDH